MPSARILVAANAHNPKDTACDTTSRVSLHKEALRG